MENISIGTTSIYDSFQQFSLPAKHMPAYLSVWSFTCRANSIKYFHHSPRTGRYHSHHLKCETLLFFFLSRLLNNLGKTDFIFQKL